MKWVLAVLTVVAIGVAYLAGYGPERQARVASETALEATRASLERAEARNRLYSLQSQLVALLATAEARNFGAAQGEATTFFNAVRAESGRPDQSHVRKALEGILAGRDSLTIALTQNDPAALAMLHGTMARLREALGDAPVQVEPATSPSPTAPSPK